MSEDEELYQSEASSADDGDDIETLKILRNHLHMIIFEIRF